MASQHWGKPSELSYHGQMLRLFEEQAESEDKREGSFYCDLSIEGFFRAMKLQIPAFHLNTPTVINSSLFWLLQGALEMRVDLADPQCTPVLRMRRKFILAFTLQAFLLPLKKSTKERAEC